MKGFFDFSVNAPMVDPDAPVYDPNELAMKYIKIAKSGVKPTQEQVDGVREGVEAYCRKVDDPETLKKDLAGIAKTWPVMRERFMNSAGLTQMMLDVGVNSRYWYSFLWLTGMRLFAVALAIKDGLMMPVSGEMVLEKVPPTDSAWIITTQEPVMQARKQTDYRVQTLLRNANGIILDGGAGLAPAYSWLYDYPLGRNGQELILCDADKRLAEYVPLMLGDAIERGKAKYVYGDYCKIAPGYNGRVSVARLTGFLSYFPAFEKRLEIMRRTNDVLVSGGNGIILADLWTAGRSLLRSGITDLWPSKPTDPVRLTPAPDVDAAIDEMDRIAKELGLKYVYVVDACNGDPKYGDPRCLTQAKAVPKCVIFLLGRDVSVDMFDPL